MDPREALLNIDFDQFGFGGRGKISRSQVRDPFAEGESENGMMDESDENALLKQVERLRRVVEDDHDRRFRSIEIHIKWLMALVLGEVVAVVGFAVSTIGAA